MRGMELRCSTLAEAVSLSLAQPGVTRRLVVCMSALLHMRFHALADCELGLARTFLTSPMGSPTYNDAKLLLCNLLFSHPERGILPLLVRALGPDFRRAPTACEILLFFEPSCSGLFYLFFFFFF